MHLTTITVQMEYIDPETGEREVCAMMALTVAIKDYIKHKLGHINITFQQTSTLLNTMILREMNQKRLKR